MRSGKRVKQYRPSCCMQPDLSARRYAIQHVQLFISQDSMLEVGLYAVRQQYIRSKAAAKFIEQRLRIG